MIERRRSRLAFLPLLFLPVAACTVSIDGDTSCEVTGQRAVDLDASGLRLLALTAGAGGLDVQGRPGLDRVLVRGEACASDVDLLEDIRLEGRRDGDLAVVRVEMPELGSGQGAAVDLTVELPSSMAVEVEDGSGPTTIRDVAGVTIHDGSGGLEVRSIQGDVTVSDGSGSLEVSDVGGSVRIDDGSGSLTVRGVQGTVTISDGSGGITVAGVGGDVVVEEDGSGDLHTDGVAGEVIVR